MPKYSGGGVTKPPTPWIGSMSTAAMVPVVWVRITSSMSSAQATPQLGYSNFSGQRKQYALCACLMSGLKVGPMRHEDCAVRLMASCVLPL